MALLLRNISGALLEVPDMGLTLDIAEEYDLTQESPNDVAESVDLVSRINASEAIILDPLDGVTPLSTSDSVAAASLMGMPNFRSFGTDLDQLTDVTISGETTNNVLKYTGSGFVNQDLAMGEIGDVDLTGITDGYVLEYNTTSSKWETKLAEDLTRIKWEGNWAETSYLKNDAVLDGAWLMIANKDTGTRPSPQPNGSPAYGMAETPVWVESDDLSTVYSGHKYTFNVGVWVQRMRVWVPIISGNTDYRFFIINITNPAVPLVTIVPPPILMADQWTEIVINNYIVTAGTELLVLVAALNSGSDTLVTGGWRNDGNSQNSQPSAEGFNRTNQNTTLRIDKDDLDSIDRSSELMGVIAGSTIVISETAVPAIFEEYVTVFAPTDAVSAVNYVVVLVDSNGTITNNATCTVNITVPIAASTDYVQETDTWLTNPDYADVDGYLSYDGVEQAGVTNDGFGVDLYVQKASISPDWDLMALSATNSSSGDNAGGGGIGEAPIDGTPYSRQDELWVSSTLAGLTDTIITAPVNNNILVYSAGNWVNQAVTLTDETVKVSANDTTAGYLNGKLIVGTGISLVENNDGGNETLTISNTAPAITDHTLLSNIGVNTHLQIDTHIADGTIHFTEASISHLNISDIGTNSHLQIDTHIGDASIHFTEGSIDHTAITNIGTNSHAAIDTHIADGTLHFTEGSIDHTAITNIGTNSHLQIDTHIGDASIHFTEASISHTNILDIGTNTHAQIDTHIADGNNPHGTTVNNLTDTTITGPVDNDLLIYSSGDWINAPSSSLPAPAQIIYYSHNGAVTQALSTTWVTNLFGTNVRTNGIYSYSAGEVTVSTAGDYVVEYNVTADATGGSRRESECKLQLNGADVDGSFSRGYHRNTAAGGNTNVAQLSISLAANDVLRVQTRTSGGNITTFAQGCRFMITKG